MKFFLITVLLSALYLIPLSSSGQQKTLAKDIVVATVNGKPITFLDIIANTSADEKQLALIFSGKKLEEQRKKLRNEALQQIIDRKLVYAEFNEKGYKLPKQITERMLDQLAADLAGGSRKLLESRARKAGLTMDELREKAKERAATGILINENCFKNVYITPKQVHDYFNKHKSEFMEVAKIKLQILYLKCNPGDITMARFTEELKKEIKEADEKAFAGYVELHSKGPNRDSGGDVGWISEDKLRKEFSSLLKGQPAGKVAGPIMTEEGYYFIRISEREESKTPDFEKVKEDIRKRLAAKEEKKNYKAYIDRLKKDALIRILKNPGELD